MQLSSLPDDILVLLFDPFMVGKNEGLQFWSLGKNKNRWFLSGSPAIHLSTHVGICFGNDMDREVHVVVTSVPRFAKGPVKCRLLDAEVLLRDPPIFRQSLLKPCFEPCLKLKTQLSLASFYQELCVNRTFFCL